MRKRAGRDLLLRGATLIDGTGSAPRPATDVLIADGRIAAVGTQLQAPDAKDIDLHGRWVLPGLIDPHVHSTFDSDLRCYIRNGVTTIRYAGTPQGVIETLRKRVREGDLCAPRILTCGPMIDGTPLSYPDLAVAVTDPQQARQLARGLLHDRGVDALLLAQQITMPLAAPIMDEARAVGVPVFGQIWSMDGTDAAELRMDQLDNTSRVFASPTVDAHLDGSRRVADRITVLRRGWCDVDWSRTDRIIAAMVDARVAYCPTLVRTEWTAGIGHGTDGALENDRDAGMFGEDERGAWASRTTVQRGAVRAKPRALVEEWARALESIGEWMRRFHSAGGLLVAGTDCQYGGILIHHELENLRDFVGLDPLQLIATATGNAGRVLGLDVGTVQADALADLLVLARDPLVDLRALREPQLVIQEGVIVYDHCQ